MRKMWSISLLAVMVLAVATPVFASDGEPPGHVVFGTDFTLRSGETLDGDLIVFGGNVTVEEGSQVDGAVVAWGGNVEIAGEVKEDVVILGSNVHLAGTARVGGELVVVGGQVRRDPGAQVEGQQIIDLTEWSWWEGWRYGPWVWGFPAMWGFENRLAGILWYGMLIFLETALIAALAGLVNLFWPQAAARVGRSAFQHPLPALGMGLLTFVVALLLSVGLIITFCLAPIGAIVLVALALAAIFGWLALGVYVGERLMPTLTPRAVAPFWVAALGAGLLTLISELLYLIPCAGWAISALLESVSVGAVVLTRFGTAEYPPLLPPPPVAEG